VRDDFEKAVKSLRRKMNDSGIMRQLKEQKLYVKPSVKRRYKQDRAIARLKGEARQG
jgi:ribosomal protein S21